MTMICHAISGQDSCVGWRVLEYFMKGITSFCVFALHLFGVYAYLFRKSITFVAKLNVYTAG
jgi:hypothetical protein